MLAILSSEINLMPDWTFFIQLGIFLAALGVVYFFIFRPVLKVLDHRLKFTAARKDETNELNSFADAEEAKRKEAITRGLKEAEMKRMQMLADVRRQAEETISKARIEAKRLFDSTEMSVEVSEERVAEEMKKSSEELAKDIINRVSA